MIAAADAEVETATELQPPPEALAGGMGAAPRAMAIQIAEEPAPAADIAAGETPEEAAAPLIAALAQADAPPGLARSLGGRSARMATPPEADGIAAAQAEAPPAAMVAKAAPPTAATNDVPPPPKLIPPEGYVRLWIDIVDTTKPAATRPSAEGTST